MKKYVFAILVIAALSLAMSGCGSVSVSGNPSGSSSTGSTGGTANFGVQTKTSGCKAHNGLPDSACSPGAILSTGTKDAICKSGYAKSVRNVPDSEKNQDYAEYGITSHAPGQYEVDHLVSLELGGSNDIANLGRSLPVPNRASMRKIRSRIICMTRFVRGRFLCNRHRQRLRRIGWRSIIRCRSK